MLFLFQKSYTGNILGIERNKSQSQYLFEDNTESTGEPEGHQEVATPPGGAPLGHAGEGCGAPWNLPEPLLRLYNYLSRKTLITRTQFQKEFRSRRRRHP